MPLSLIDVSVESVYDQPLVPSSGTLVGVPLCPTETATLVWSGGAFVSGMMQEATLPTMAFRAASSEASSVAA